MTTRTTYVDDVVELMKDLNLEEQRLVLEYVRSLLPNLPPGEPGWKAVQHAREINFPKEDLEEIQRAIEEDLEQVDDFPEVDLDG